MAYTLKPQIRLDENATGHTAKKFQCPACGQKRFVRFYDFEKNEYLPDEFGRCDRLENCGEHNPPYEWLKKQKDEERERSAVLSPDKPQRPTRNTPFRHKPPPPPVVQFGVVPRDIVNRTLSHYDENTLFLWLALLLGKEAALQVAARYFLGTAKGNGTIFWQIDRFMRTRTGAKIQYDLNGKRLRDVPPQRLYKVENGFTPCLFGEHLMFTVSDTVAVALVESEKTAMICSHYLPTLDGGPVIWLASSSMNGLTEDKIKCLAGKKVIMVPDMSFAARATWGQVPMRKADRIHPVTGKKTRVPDPTGELVPGYVSYADKIRSLGADVYFFDPEPDTHDGSDIADVLIKIPPPNATTLPTAPRYQQPDPLSLYLATATNELSNLTTQQLRSSIDTVLTESRALLAETPVNASNLPDKTAQRLTLPTGVGSWRITAIDGDKVVFLTEPPHYAKHQQKFFDNAHYLSLVKNLSIFEGTIEYQPNGQGEN